MKDVRLNQLIGFRVYRIRTRRGLTILGLAELAGIHKNTLVRVESGIGVSVYVLFKLSAALRVTVDDLIGKAQHVVPSEHKLDLDAGKAGKVVFGTESLFGASDPSPARPVSTTTVGSSKGRASSAQSVRKHNPGQ